MDMKHSFVRLSQFVALTVLFLIIFFAGALIFPVLLPPDVTAEPGPLPAGIDMLVIGAVNVLIIMLILLNTRWYGWKLYLAVAVAYYGVQTFMGQIETWYFLTQLTVSDKMLPMLFLMGTTVPVLSIPLAMLILGKWKQTPGIAVQETAAMSLKYPPSPWKAQWLVKAVILAFTYALLYFLAGYYIAWQNPDVVAYYYGVDTGSFFKQMQLNLSGDPALLPFQLFRGLLWALFALPVIRLMKGSPWLIAVVVGLLLSVPLNISHLLANPLMPSNSVRMSHMVETASSTFVFGLIATCLLHRMHCSWKDLMGQERVGVKVTPASRPV